MFFVLIGVEALVAKVFFPPVYKAHADNEVREERSLYRLNDMIACTALGTFQAVGVIGMEMLGVALDFKVYKWVYENMRMTTIDPKVHPILTYIACMLGKDFGYYWCVDDTGVA